MAKLGRLLEDPSELARAKALIRQVVNGTENAPNDGIAGEMELQQWLDRPNRVQVDHAKVIKAISDELCFLDGQENGDTTKP